MADMSGGFGLRRAGEDFGERHFASGRENNPICDVGARHAPAVAVGLSCRLGNAKELGGFLGPFSLDVFGEVHGYER